MEETPAVTESVSPYVGRVNEWLAEDPPRAVPLVAATGVQAGSSFLGFPAGVLAFGASASVIGAMNWFGDQPFSYVLFLVAILASGLAGIRATTAMASSRWHRIFGVRPATSMVLGLTADRLMIWRQRLLGTPRLELLVDVPREGIRATKPVLRGFGAGGSVTTLDGLAGLTLHLPDGPQLTLASSRSFGWETRRVIVELNDPGSTLGVGPADLPRPRASGEPPSRRRVGVLVAAISFVALAAIVMGARERGERATPSEGECAAIRAPDWLVAAVEEQTPAIDELWLLQLEDESDAVEPPGGRRDSQWLGLASMGDEGLLSLGVYVMRVDFSASTVRHIGSVGPLTEISSNWPPVSDDELATLLTSGRTGLPTSCARSIFGEGG